jgi:2-desacetyl-2-hydroxyethyl bacteriochlorophyllide A dehydrogenase
MRSVLYTGERTFRVVDCEPRPPGPGEVRIAVAYTGICGTDLHIRHGAMDQRVTLPAVIGHEMAGRIAEVGDGVADWQPGDPVTVMPLDWCGTCPACKAGHSHICHNLNFVGIDSAGALQGSWTVPARLLVRLPAELPLNWAALVEPTAVAVHDVRRADISPGEKVVVVGGGPVGLLVARVAAVSGADVMVLELDARRRGVAQRLGLSTVDPTTEDVPSLVDKWTAGAGAAVAFEVSGSPAGVGIATQVLATRGRLVMVAIHPTPREVDLFRVFWRELTLIGARVYERRDVARAVELLARGDVPAAELISRVVPIDDINEAFDALEAGGEVKVLVDCRDATDA